MPAIRIIDDHIELVNIGSNTHAQIDTHIAAADNYVKRDGSLALTADWDIGDARKIKTDEIIARDSAGLKLHEDGGKGILVKDGGYVEIGSTPDYGNVRPFKIYDDGVTGGARLTLISTSGLLGPGLELVNNGNAARRGLIILSDEGDLNYGFQFYTTFSSVVSEKVRITGEGRLGIGLTAPQQLLHIHGVSTTSYIKLTNSTTGSTSADGFDIATVGNDVYLINREAGSLRIRTSNTDRIFIASDGKTGVNTASPTALFDINSDILRLRTAKTPATAGAAGNQGDICWDAGYIYVCTATNSWERAAIAAW